VTQLVGLGEQLVKSLLDVVTDAIDQLGDAPGLMGWRAPRRYPVSIVSNRWQLRSGVVNHGEFIVLRDLWRAG